MPQPATNISQATMSPKERALCSRLTKLIQAKHLIRGTLNQRLNTCGNSSCKCAHGEGHPALYLVVSEDGKLRQIYISKSREAAVRQWVEHYQQAQELLEKISQLSWTRLK